MCGYDKEMDYSTTDWVWGIFKTDFLRDWNTWAAIWNISGNYLGNGKIHHRQNDIICEVYVVGWIVLRLTNHMNPLLLEIARKGF